MAVQLSSDVRDAMLDALEAEIGTGAILRIRTGSAPANCGTADSGTIIAALTLPSDWLATASGGTKAKSGTWEDASADNTGVAAHFRIYDSGGTVCHLQGTVGEGTGDLQLVNTDINAGQAIEITSFTLSAGNA